MTTSVVEIEARARMSEENILTMEGERVKTSFLVTYNNNNRIKTTRGSNTEAQMRETKLGRIREVIHDGVIANEVEFWS